MEIAALPKGKKIILFDGVCNLCDSTVQYLIGHDKKDVFRFVAIQSDLGTKILKHIAIDPAAVDSVILYEPGTAYYIKSSAVIEISKSLGGFVSLLALFYVVPPFLRNPLYDLIARHRYKWFGKKTNCLIPTLELQSKFLI